VRPAQRDNEVDGLDEPTVVILVDGLYRLDMGRHGRVLPFGVYLAGWSWNRNTNTIGNWELGIGTVYGIPGNQSV